MIVIIDYGMGNLQSVSKGIEKCGGNIILSSSFDEIRNADALVLPGVGAFESGMKNLTEMGIIPVIQNKVAEGIPFIGICLGMQLLFSESEENGLHKGLDIIPGCVVKFPETEKIPHMGWNQVTLKKEAPLFSGIADGSYFYFVHSYYCIPENPDDTLGKTNYGISFTSAAARGNVLGTQFHPEKSQNDGMMILTNFIKLADEGGK